MTEQKAIETLEYIRYCNDYKTCAESIALDMAVESLKKQSIFEQIKWERDVVIEQLESIGVGLGRKMDDVKEALEKQIPIPVLVKERYCYEDYFCPVCKKQQKDTYKNRREGCHCERCGQKLYWSEEE